MDLLRPVVPANFKPVAVIVEAQSGDVHLDKVSEEVKHIQGRFQALDFEVLHFKNPSKEDIIGLFSKGRKGEGCRDRITVFHFAGHSNEQGMGLPKWDESRSDVDQMYFQGLAGFMSKLACLRLVFINGCESHGFEEHFSHQDVGVVVATTRIPDHSAKDFAIKFYDEWTESAEAEVTVKDAFDYVKSTFESDNQYQTGEAPDGFRNDSDHSSITSTTNFPWRIACNANSTLPNCFSASFFGKLLDKDHLSKSGKISLGWSVVCLAALIVAAMSLWFAYFSPFSSPAFQASFGYALTSQDFIDGVNGVQESGRNQFFVRKVCKIGAKPMAGAIIELIRVILGVSAILATFLLLGPPFEMRHLSRTMKVLLIVLLLVVLVSVARYNLLTAPADLATNWKDKDNQWLSVALKGEGSASFAEVDMFQSKLLDMEKNNYFCLDEAVWENAGKTCRNDSWDDRLVEYRSFLKKNIEGSKGLARYRYSNEMFLYPYVAYCFYSLVLFGFVATLLFFCISIHTYKTANLVSFLVQATKGSKRVSIHREEQRKIVNESHKLLFVVLRRYSIFLCMLFVFLDYEVTWGFLTLASGAKMLTLFAIGMLFVVGTSLLGVAHWKYTEAFIADDLDLISDVRRPNEIWEDVWIRGACWLIPIILGHVWFMLGHTL